MYILQPNTRCTHTKIYKRIVTTQGFRSGIDCCGANAPGNFSLVWLWCEIHTEVVRYFGSTWNGVTDLVCDLELVQNEAVLSRGRGPGTHIVLLLKH